MLKIGDFSKLSRISIRMLRYYDDCGLLKPEKVDSFTGYRYYKESQHVTWRTMISLFSVLPYGTATLLLRGNLRIARVRRNVYQGEKKGVE